MNRTPLAFGILALLMLVFTPYAANTYPIAATNTCTQLNSTFLACADGIPIKVQFSVTAPYAPSFGTFSVAQVDYANVSEPLNAFGNQCTVPSGSTSSCSVTISGIPLSAGNGTLAKSIKLKLTSISYPQISFNRSVNITIYHYLTANGSLYLRIYDSAYSEYLGENLTYGYFCSGYGICSSGVAYGISVAGAYLSLAEQNINHGSTQQAIYNVTEANRTLGGGRLQYNSFVSASNRIVNNVIRARYMLANLSNSYSLDYVSLNSCPTKNTTYGRNIASQISKAEGYPMQTTLNGSVTYLQLVMNISAYNNNAIAYCGGAKSKSSGSGLSARTIYIAVIAIVAILLIIYIVLRIRTSREIRRIREGADERKEESEKKDEEKRHGNQPEEEAGADEKK